MILSPSTPQAATQAFLRTLLPFLYEQDVVSRILPFPLILAPVGKTFTPLLFTPPLTLGLMLGRQVHQNRSVELRTPGFKSLARASLVYARPSFDARNSGPLAKIDRMPRTCQYCRFNSLSIPPPHTVPLED